MSFYGSQKQEEETDWSREGAEEPSEIGIDLAALYNAPG